MIEAALSGEGRPAGPGRHSSGGINNALATVRSHLGMDIAFVSEFVGDRRFFRHVVAGPGVDELQVGDSLPLDEGYCLKIVEGRLPELMPDTSLVAAATEDRLTHSMPIGAHLGVPLRFSDGELFGTFCCVRFKPDPSLSDRDLHVMRAVADVVAYELESDVKAGRELADTRDRVESWLGADQPRMVFQPIFRLSDRLVVGSEALARFPDGQRPDLAFAQAENVGLRTALERQAMRNAVRSYRAAWARQPNLRLGLNASPTTILAGDLLPIFDDCPHGMVVIELTEHEHVEDYGPLIEALKPLRAAGIKIAIDDAGAGYASLRHVLSVAPDIVKLDISMTRDIDTDHMRQAMATAVVAFGREIDCQIVAEGVESDSEIETLREIGVFAAQGFHLARPMPIEDLVSTLG